MAVNVSNDFRTTVYSGESLYSCYLTIGSTTVSSDLIESIKITRPIIDTTQKYFYIGTFISDKVEIAFKNIDAISIASGDELTLSIALEVNGSDEMVNCGTFIIDELTDDYYKNHKITAFDDAIKMAEPVDSNISVMLDEHYDSETGTTTYSTTLETFLQRLCARYNIILGSYPNVNRDTIIGNYDSTISGKQYISWIAEMMGGNAKIDRSRALNIIPLNRTPVTTIDATRSSEFTIGEKYEITGVTYFDAVRNLTMSTGLETGNILVIRQDNLFVTSQTDIDNIYSSLIANPNESQGKLVTMENSVKHKLGNIQFSGNLEQIGTPTPSTPINVNVVTGNNIINIIGKNLFNKVTPTIIASTATWTPTEDGGTYSNSAAWGQGIRWQFELNNNETYTFKANGFINNCYCYIRTYTDSTYSTIKTRLLADGTGNITKTFTLDSEYLEILFSNSSAINDINISQIQLEHGDNATNYEDYQINNYSINFGSTELCKIGDYKDKIRKSTGKNLFDENYENISGNVVYKSIYVGNGVFTMSTNAPLTSPDNYANLFFLTGQVTSGASTSSNGVSSGIPRTISSTNGYVTVGYRDIYYVNPRLYNTMIEEGSNVTEYEPYGEQWYIRKEIGKITLNGEETWQNNYGESLFGTSLSIKKDIASSLAYSNYYAFNSIQSGLNSGLQNGQFAIQIDQVDRPDNIYIKNTSYTTTTDFKNWLSTHNTIIYYPLKNATTEIINDISLLNQLENIKNSETYTGVTNITTTTENIKPYLDILYYIYKPFTIYSLTNKNYGDISLDAYDIVTYQVDNISYNTFYDSKITYKASVMADINVNIPNKQQEVTTNIKKSTEGSSKRKIWSEVDQVNQVATIAAEKAQDNSDELGRLSVRVNSIEGLFKITGGSNLIKNSQFLLKDEVWSFTNNGNNPYHTELGQGYNGSLIGSTVALANIVLRNTIMTSTNNNIVELKRNTTHTLNYYVSQDANVTTTITLTGKNNGVVIYTETITTNDTPITMKNYTKTIESIDMQDTDYILQISTSSSYSGYVTIYDLMLNSGDKKSWEPAQSEVYSTTVQMSKLGVTVYSSGKNIATLMTSDGFRINRATMSDGNIEIGTKISEFDDKGVETEELKSTSLGIGSKNNNGEFNSTYYIMTELNNSGVKHHVEYFVIK